MKKLLLVALMLAAVQAGAQDNKAGWECAGEALANTTRGHDATKGPTLTKEEQAQLDEDTKRCFQHTTSATLEQLSVAAGQDYMDCAFTAVKVLDDGISDANTIALGARSQCVSYLTALAKVSNTISVAQWGEMLHPGVVNKVLVHRVESKLQRAKPPPRANKQQM